MFNADQVPLSFNEIVASRKVHTVDAPGFNRSRIAYDAWPEQFSPPDFDQFRRPAANVICRLLFTEQIGEIPLEIVLKSVSMTFAFSDALIE